MNCDSKPESHVHAGRIRLHGRIDELTELGEVHDVVETFFDFSFGETEHDAVDEDVFAARNLGMKSGAELDERGNPARDLYGARARLRDAGNQFERGALTRP